MLLLLLLLSLVLLREIGWNLLESAVELTPIHVWSLPCSHLKSPDFFSQSVVQSCIWYGMEHFIMFIPELEKHKY
jgi:hypothetical protein